MTSLLCAMMALLLFAPVQLPTTRTPQQAVDELLAADRAFAAAAAQTTVIPGLTPMFASDVIMPLPTGKLAHGVAEVVEGLKAVPDNAAGRLEWVPIRGGISGDGQHGFTFGFMTLHKADGSVAPLKYMTYWVKGAGGWRAVAFKRGRRPEGLVGTTLMSPSLPATLVAPTAVSDATRQELVAAEKAFSDDAQQIGLGPAFAKFGWPDAVNFGGPASPNYVVGNDAIAKLVDGGQGGPSPVSWSCDTAIVASSGDLGVSIGFIRPNAPGPDGKAAPGSPFFTIWRKVNGVWKYIAE
ncbi:MAG: hypothetical protein KAY59_05450 [Acidobacteria bacterium]|nr:hypothetical protein [Acidobacteriota bacterium]